MSAAANRPNKFIIDYLNRRRRRRTGREERRWHILADEHLTAAAATRSGLTGYPDPSVRLPCCLTTRHQNKLAARCRWDSRLYIEYSLAAELQGREKRSNRSTYCFRPINYLCFVGERKRTAAAEARTKLSTGELNELE